MKILSIDTSSNICGVSILDDDNLIYRQDFDSNKTHSENLMPMIQSAFIKTNLSLKDINLLVCDKGPGSFTGLRIGIATIKAFHDSLNIPCVGVSSLEALAYNIEKDGFIISIIDCKNDNCYFALYELKNNTYTEIIKPSTDSIINCLNIIRRNCLNQSYITFVGDGSDIYKNIIMQNFKNCIFCTPNENKINSYNLGRAGFYKFQKTGEHENILPLYLKKPQAQRQLEEKIKKEG